MAQLATLLSEIDKLEPSEREQLMFALVSLQPTSTSSSLEWLSRLSPNNHPSIVATPDGCGGAARLIRTRIPVWTLERMRQLGLSESEILKSYPSLLATDLVQAWLYAARNREEIETAIRENEED